MDEPGEVVDVLGEFRRVFSQIAQLAAECLGQRVGFPFQPACFNGQVGNPLGRSSCSSRARRRRSSS